MKADDELKEFLGGMFRDFESDPHPQAWERIEGTLVKMPAISMWPKIVTGALVGVFFASVCHAPVHSQLALGQSGMKIEQVVSTAFSKAKAPTVEKLSSDLKKKQLKSIDNKQVISSLKVAEKLNDVELEAIELVEKQTPSAEKITGNESISPLSKKETGSFSPELLDKNPIKELPFQSAVSEVKAPRLASKRTGFVKLWSVSAMPLATYQRMYVLPEANDQIQQIHSQQPLNANRTGLRMGTELTLLSDRSAWRFGLSYTQMRQQTQYTLAKNSYTLNTTANLGKPSVSQQTEQVQEMTEWHLLGIRADRQYQLAFNGRHRYFVSLGTEGAVEVSSRQPYVWGHVSLGMQKLLTPRVWMSVEPTASYSLLSKTTTNGLLRVNPYNFGVKISLGLMP